MTAQTPPTRLPPENVQAYPRPPALERVKERLAVWFNGTEIAATRRGWRVLETHHAPTYYFPPEDVREDLLRPAFGRSLCEWKGPASYWDIVVGGEVAARAVWSLPEPTRRFRPIERHFAFYPGWVDACYVGDIPAQPQPGGFYGGWVTPNLTGTVKGAPGTEHW